MKPQMNSLIFCADVVESNPKNVNYRIEINEIKIMRTDWVGIKFGWKK